MVLSALVKCYYTRHIEIHRDSRALNSVGEQVDKIRGRLRETEEQLNKEKAKEHIISLAESTASITAELRAVREDARKAEVELVQQRAFLQSIGGVDALETERTPATPPREAPSETAVASRGTASKPTSTSQTEAAATAGQSRELDLAVEKANLAKMVARMKFLNARLADVTARAERLATEAPKIAELERTQKLEENNYIDAESSYEKANREKDMDLGNPTKIPNISEIQSPTPGKLCEKRTL